MQLKQLVVLLSCSIFVENGSMPNIFDINSPSLNKETLTVSNSLCGIDNFYDSLLGLKISNVLFYRETNTPSGNKGLIIWQEKNCIYGVKFEENVLGVCKREEINPSNQNLGLIALKFFYSGEQQYSVAKSKIETMHDFKIIIQGFINGKGMKTEFYDSAVGKRAEFIPEIARLCQNIIYNW